MRFKIVFPFLVLGQGRIGNISRFETYRYEKKWLFTELLTHYRAFPPHKVLDGFKILVSTRVSW
jgi:hypothetical protein